MSNRSWALSFRCTVFFSVVQLAATPHVGARDGRQLWIAYAPVFVELCSERKPEVSSGLRDAYPKWSLRLTPEERELQRQLETAGEYSDFRARFDKAPQEQIADQCEAIAETVLGEVAPADPAFSSPTATWNTFVQAARAGNRPAALKALTGHAKKTFREQFADTETTELAQWADSLESFYLTGQHSDGKFQTAMAVGKDKLAGEVLFVRIGPNWRIAQM